MPSLVERIVDRKVPPHGWPRTWACSQENMPEDDTFYVDMPAEGCRVRIFPNVTQAETTDSPLTMDQLAQVVVAISTSIGGAAPAFSVSRQTSFITADGLFLPLLLATGLELVVPPMGSLTWRWASWPRGNADLTYGLAVVMYPLECP